MDDIISREEFEKLSLEEAKEELIKLVNQVPDENMEELYNGIKQIVEEYGENLDIPD
ncbi:hypothetical protein [Robinsoniella peoriensis]|uniref:hypothetical protein n=1 Tax=Robinsoniella peoriensis TaxID=180332 RepID=UPI0037524930